MKNVTFSFLLLISATIMFSQTSTLKSGAPVAVKLVNDITSNGSEAPVIVVDYDIADKEGNVLITAGTTVEYRLDRQKARGWGKPGSLTLTVLSTQSVDGQAIPLSGYYNAEGMDRKDVATWVGIGGFFGLPVVGVLFGFAVKGTDAKITGNFIMPSVKTTTATKIEY